MAIVKDFEKLKMTGKERQLSLKAADQCIGHCYTDICHKEDNPFVTPYLTLREVQVWGELRQTKEQATRVKRHLKRVAQDMERLKAETHSQPSSSKLIDMSVEQRKESLKAEQQRLSYWLTKLRQKWAELSRCREDAARERMQLLGHIP